MQENEIQAIVAGTAAVLFRRQDPAAGLSHSGPEKAETGHRSAIRRKLPMPFSRISVKVRLKALWCETGLVLSEISYMLRHIRRFAREKTVYTPLSQFAAAAASGRHPTVSR